MRNLMRFANKISKLSDWDLVLIVTIYRNDYVPEAILTVENEINKRRAKSPQIEAALQKVTSIINSTKKSEIEQFVATEITYSDPSIAMDLISTTMDLNDDHVGFFEFFGDFQFGDFF